MKLEKAIEIGTHAVPRGISPHDQEAKNALKLLIEAGKRVLKRRSLPSTWEPGFLPGETKE